MEIKEKIQEIMDKLVKDRDNWEHQLLIKMKFGGSVRDYLLSMGDFKEHTIIEDIDNKIDEWVKDYKTSWKYLQRKGYIDAEHDGDCIFLNAHNSKAIDELKLTLSGSSGK